MELIYAERQQIIITSDSQINIPEIEEIANEVLQGRKSKVQSVDRFGKTVEITSESITEQDRNDIP